MALPYPVHSVVVMKVQLISFYQSIRKYYHQSHNTYNSNRCTINLVFIKLNMLFIVSFNIAIVCVHVCAHNYAVLDIT